MKTVLDVMSIAPPDLWAPSPAKRPRRRLHMLLKLYNSDLEREMRCKDENGLGCDVNAGLKPLAQYMEALRAGATSPLLVDFVEN